MERNIQIDKLTNNILQGKGNAQILKDRQEIFEAYYSIYSGEEINEGALSRFFKKVALTAVIGSIGVSAMAQSPIPYGYQEPSLKQKIEYTIQSVLKTEPVSHMSKPADDENIAYRNQIKDIARIVSKENVKFVDSIKCKDAKSNKIFYIMFFVDKNDVDTAGIDKYVKSSSEIHDTHNYGYLQQY
jgi:hypothetical protein